MATSKKISELTTASAITGSEIFPLVQGGETRQASVSLLISSQAPVQSVNGLTGVVMLDVGDLPTYSTINTLIFSAIASVSVRVDTVSALASSVSVIANNALLAAASVSARVDTAAALILAPRPYNVVFDFGASTVPMGEYPKVAPAGLTFYVLPSCSGSQVTFNTSAFPTALVSIPIMYPTSTTLGILQIDVSGTTIWPAIATTSIAPGQTFGVQTSVSSDPTLTGLVISFAGWYRP